MRRFFYNLPKLRFNSSRTLSGIVMPRLRLIRRFVFATILVMGSFYTFMVLQSNDLIPNARSQVRKKESQTGENPSQDCTNPVYCVPLFQATDRSEKNRISGTDSSQSQTPHDGANSDHPTTTKTVKRRSLVIFGDDRSGTTFLTRMFYNDSSIFTVYEPLWVTSRWSKSEAGRDRVKDVNEVIGAVTSCQFVDNPIALKFLESTSKKWAPGLHSNPFRSPFICNKTGKEPMSCPDSGSLPNVVQDVCLRHFKHSVTKVAIVRVPDRKLSHIFPKIIHDHNDTEVRLLHVVRDPRGSVNSRIKLRWIKDYQSRRFPHFPRDTCEGILQNVKYGASLEGSLRERYKLLRYKDIALFPVKTALEIYKFAGFEMPESVIRWIVKSTQPSKELLAKEAKNAFSPIRNASANFEKWRREAPIERTRIIEKECSELFDILGLERLAT
ncbi:PREDICTED: carbohydrate sulfotransferase 3-like isoform X1 [Acropora digitifera]|uniref:carbohydrate sulfotransferase 3-like isoform X1 n=2 Tax=Acropora digitifera TaxID=70779 RepID=UPI00077A3E4D|nr:PREDICTED: carbohydrate sulfotransferase 3-like isoform X1 [Acropora digitifera]